MALLIRAEEVTGILTHGGSDRCCRGRLSRVWPKSGTQCAATTDHDSRRGEGKCASRWSSITGWNRSFNSRGACWVSKEVQTYHSMGGPVTVLFNVKDASLMAILVGRMSLKELPAERPTPIRTAATSAVGTRWLARENSKVLGIIGAGEEAKYHLLALSKLRPFSSAKVDMLRTDATRLEFSRLMQKLVPCEVKPVSSAQEAIAGADVVLTATNSNVPVFNGDWLEPGTHVTSIMGGNVGLVRAGVAQSKRRELDDTSIRRSKVIVVNSRDQAIQDEQGDLYDPVQAGFLVGIVSVS